MRPSGPTSAAAPGAGGAAPAVGAHRPPPLRLSAAVMFVHDLGPSLDFYRELLAWDVGPRTTEVALLVGPDGEQLSLRARGPRTQHPLGQIGVQHLVWTAVDEGELRRCEGVLRAWSSHVTTTTTEGVTVVEGTGPNRVPVVVTFPGPGPADASSVVSRLYGW